MSNVYGIERKTAIITGASRGIGKGIARRFVRAGADVVLCSRTENDVERVAEEITSTGDTGRAFPVECNITEEIDVRDLVDTTIEEFDRIDVLVNNVGASFTEWVSDIDREGWDDVLETNLTGPFQCIQQAGEHMRDGDGGAIINITSAATDWGSPKLSHYGAAKAGLDHLTASVAAEWGPFGIRVNAVAPGLIATERIGSLIGVDAEEINEAKIDRHVGTPDEIAKVVQFLASPGASFIQGETIVVKGMPRIPQTDYHEDIETEMDW